MEEKIIEFMEKVKIKDKNFSFYTDYNKGIAFTFNTVNLLPKLDYLEPDEKQYKVLLASKKIDDLNYNEIETTRAVLKNEITGKEEDKETIVEKTIKAKEIWNLSNALGVFTSYTTKEEAINSYNELLNKIMEYLK